MMSRQLFSAREFVDDVVRNFQVQIAEIISFIVECFIGDLRSVHDLSKMDMKRKQQTNSQCGIATALPFCCYYSFHDKHTKFASEIKNPLESIYT